MNNSSVQGMLDDCSRELTAINSLVNGLGLGSTIVPYLSKYGLIKACGTIEQSIKAVVADKCSFRTKPQVKRFLTIKVRNGSTNPSYDNICKMLKEFDPGWNNGFKATVQGHPQASQIRDSLQSLVDARNEFAHGGSPRVSITDVLKYYNDARVVVESVDSVVG